MSMGGQNEARLDFKTTSDVSSLQQLQQSMQGVNQWLETLNQTMSRSIAVQTQMATSLGKISQANEQNTKATDSATKSNSAFLDTIMKGVAAGAEFAAGYLSVSAALNIVSNAFDFVTGSAGRAIAQMEAFLQQSFQLADSAQRMEYLWMYQYGGPQGGGPAIASQLAAWIPNFAMNSPYTMMQIMGSVGPLSQMGLSFQGLQRYLPLISDLAATHTSIFGGGDMLPINYAALAVMEATKGYSRRLLMELQIRPNELTKYGLKFVGDKESGQIANPEMFLPALEAYAKDKGYTGASKRMAHETISGLQASLTDRYQSFQRRLMGENIPDPDAGKLNAATEKLIDSGQLLRAMQEVGADAASLKSYGIKFSGRNVTSDKETFRTALEQFSEDKFYASFKDQPQFRSGTIFSVILQGMKDFSSWWDNHQSTFDQISKFIADVGGKLLTLARSSVSNALTSAFEGFTKAFTGGEALRGMGNSIMRFLTDPRNQDLIRQLGNWAGTTIGQGATQFAEWAQPHVNDAISWLSDPKNQQNIKDTAQFLTDTLGGALHGLVTDLAQLKQDWDDFVGLFSESDKANLAANFQNLGWLVGGFFQMLGDRIKTALALVDDILNAFKLLGDFLSTGHLDSVALYNLDTKMMKDLTSFITAGIVNINIDQLAVQYDPDRAAARQRAVDDAMNKQYKKPPPVPPAHGGPGGPRDAATLGGWGSGSYNETQNNTYNIQGATSMDIQRLIDQNARKLSNRQNIFSKMPGGLQYNTVGLI